MTLLRKMGTAFHAGLSYFRGWRTREKIVVIESDDWGSIRVSSREAYERLMASGCAMDRSPYSLDALETDEDLRMLFEVLNGVKDSRGRPACMTANMVMANPDFIRIREAGFREYFYEPVAARLARDEVRRNVSELWAQGAARLLFVPQLHAREHVRWWEWLTALQTKVPEAIETYELEMCGVPQAASRRGQSFYSPPYLSDEELAACGVDLETMIVEGAELFQKHFGYASQTTIAPNYTWTDLVEKVWKRLGITGIQGGLFQVCPSTGGATRRPHYLGQRNSAGGVYLVRNCMFEPAASSGDCVKACLREIGRAFLFHKPAVLCSHRVNYVGSIFPGNRARGLDCLARLLDEIVRRWPDVVFLGSSELLRQINMK